MSLWTWSNNTPTTQPEAEATTDNATVALLEDDDEWMRAVERHSLLTSQWLQEV